MSPYWSRRISPLLVMGSGYSVRRASVGLTDAARPAGMLTAKAATETSARMAIQIENGSAELV